MVVPTIALFASPPSSVYSTTHPCQISAHATYDFDLSARSSSSASSSTSSSQKSMVGGLSCLFSTPTVKHTPFSGDREELGSLWHDRGEDLKELSSSFYCAPSKYLSGGSIKRDQSPVSVLQGPISCSSSPPTRIARERSADVGFRSSIHGSFRGGANRLFNGSVRHALGSCIDYDSPTFEVRNDGIDVGSSCVAVDELTFNIDDAFVEASCEPYAKELLLGAQLRHKIFFEDLVVKALYEAEKAHRGQMRASGDPYLQHCVETAVVLAMIGADSKMVAAGLLHDTFDDSFLTYDYLFKTFGAGIADLVEGVSKLSQLSKLARENNTADRTVEADRLHTMFLAMADPRAVLIKLADRLHNMTTLEALPLVKQQRFAKETLEIFAPLANRLGVALWKEQLEHLCFKHLNPDQYKELSFILAESFDKSMITSATEKLEQALQDEAISYHDLYGRLKSLYSIHCKMLKKKLNIDEIHDIRGLRLIVENEEDCYRALRVVHQLWSEVPGKFKDYINHPKFNGYQSLHTVVMGENMVPLEVQIRTMEMHMQSEIGFAAHWRYKEGDCKHSSFVLQMVEWARWVVTWLCETRCREQSSIGYADSIKAPCAFPTHSDDCSYSYMPRGVPDGPVFIMMLENDKMTVQEFPANSTVMDLVERAGLGSSRLSPYGFSVKELRPKLNGVPVNDPTCKLKMGDVLELTPAIPNKSLMDCRDEIQRMYDRDMTTASGVAGGRS